MFSSNLRQCCAHTGHECQGQDGKGELRLHLRQLKTAEKLVHGCVTPKLHSIKASREKQGISTTITYSRSALLKSTRNGNKLGLHGGILNEKSLGRGIRHFSFNGEDRQTCVLSLRQTHTAPALDQAEERQDRSHFGQNDSSSNRFLSTKSTVKILLTPASLSYWILSRTWPRLKRKKTHEKPTG